MQPLSVEDIANTSDETIVRRRFDARNMVFLTVLLIIFAFVSLIELNSNIGRRNGLDVGIAASNIVIVLLMLFLMRDVFRVEKRGGDGGLWQIGRWMRRHVRATSIAYAIVQYALVIAFTRRGHGYVPWAMTFPFFALGFRLLTAEIAFLHIVLAAVPTTMVLFQRPHDFVPMLIAMGTINVMCAAIETFLSVRQKREITRDWKERRTQAREQIRMRDELFVARQLQMSMLPECAPTLDWIDVAGASVPATEVGGDYFDYFDVGGALAIVEGDVAGHGLASGIVLASLRSGFTLLRESLTEPAAVLQRLHDLVAHTSRQRILVTCVVLLLDPATRRARIASAGHPPVIVRNDGHTSTIDLFAPPLGVRLPMSIAQHETTFAPGDVFVLHTDGVYESTSPSGESYGIERIVEVVHRCAGDDAATIRDAILRDVEQFRAGEAAADDVTVVVARVTG
jgi:serine phosphatase RsbU (regulator of sigma subunit)